MPHRFSYLEQELEELKSLHRYRKLTPRIPRGPRFEEDGRLLHHFGSNDYLGMAGDPPVDRSRFENLPAGSGASGLVSGWTDAHQELAETIAQLEGTDASVVFPSGFAACSGTVATLAGQDDLILSDALNHASLIDGCRLSSARCLVYPHRDANSVASMLQQHRSSYRQVWIVTDGIFSMDGSIAPLPELCELASQYQAEVIVDEAHSTGVLGDHGSGLCEALGVKDQVAIRIGTLSKAIGVQGGFVAGPKPAIEYLVNRCRSLIYSTSLSPRLVKIATTNIKRIHTEPHRRRRVKELARRIRRSLDVPAAHPLETSLPIIPIVLGEDRLAIEASKRLLDLGFFVPVIRPPTVPEGSARLRISVSAAHGDESVDGLIAALTSNA